MLPNSVSSDNGDTASLQRIIELLLKDLKEANNTIGRLIEENTHLKTEAAKNYESSWHLQNPKDSKIRNKPMRHNETVTNISNRFDALDRQIGIENHGSQKSRRTPPMIDRTSKVTDQRKKITVVADSHGRGIADNLCSSLKKEYNVCGLVKPGAKISEVLKNSTSMGNEMQNGDHLVIIGGSNDVSYNESAMVISSLNENLSKLKKGKVWLVDIPTRHDLSDESCVNKEINSTNRKLKKLAKLHENVVIVETAALDRLLFTRHGQHLNSVGKEHLSSLILQNISKECKSTAEEWIPLPQSNNGATEQTDSNSSNQITANSANIPPADTRNSGQRHSTRPKKPPTQLNDFLC